VKHVARKRFGQHFLADGGIIDAIVREIAPRPGQAMVEIGPGLAALTQPLVERVGQLTVIELDRDLAARLRQHAQRKVVESDVLKVDFTALADALGTPKLRVVGNLPYNISSPILFHVLEHAEAVRDMHFMLQKEVVDRMGAEPGSKVYGRLSVMLQAKCRVTPLFTVGPGAFRPPPKVDSAVVRLVPRPAGELGIADPALFEHLVRDAFGQRRKTMRNAVMQLCRGEDIEAAGLRPDARAEQLAVADFVRLANHIAATSGHAELS
jgi:16S rRNA (adenine1518-N6/adenine1519-N6)-dimethyltransferase